MSTNDKITKIMTTNVFCVDVDEELIHVSSLMKKHKVRHVPVLAAGKLVGIISQTDILRLSFGGIFEDSGESDLGIFETLKLEQVMVAKPSVATTSDTIADVAQLFIDASFHAVPVVNHSQEVVGIVSTTDVIRYFLQVDEGRASSSCF